MGIILRKYKVQTVTSMLDGKKIKSDHELDH